MTEQTPPPEPTQQRLKPEETHLKTVQRQLEEGGDLAGRPVTPGFPYGTTARWDEDQEAYVVRDEGEITLFKVDQDLESFFPECIREDHAALVDHFRVYQAKVVELGNQMLQHRLMQLAIIEKAKERYGTPNNMDESEEFFFKVRPWVEAERAEEELKQARQHLVNHEWQLRVNAFLVNLAMHTGLTLPMNVVPHPRPGADMTQEERDNATLKVLVGELAKTQDGHEWQQFQLSTSTRDTHPDLWLLLNEADRTTEYQAHIRRLLVGPSAQLAQTPTKPGLVDKAGLVLPGQ